jgi:hypothetical protein
MFSFQECSCDLYDWTHTTILRIMTTISISKGDTVNVKIKNGGNGEKFTEGIADEPFEIFTEKSMRKSCSDKVKVIISGATISLYRKSITPSGDKVRVRSLDSILRSIFILQR